MQWQRTTAEVRSLTRILGANMLRIVAGAGKPSELHDQMLSCLVAIEEFSKAHGRWPDHEIKSAFELPSELREEPSDPEYSAAPIMPAKDRIAVAAMRFMAARLLNQGTPLVNANFQLEQAIERLTELREKRSKARKRISRTRGGAARKP
jgi:hypothetical protein